MQKKEINKEILKQYIEGSDTELLLQQINQYLKDPAYAESLANFMQTEWNAIQQEPTPATRTGYDFFLAAAKKQNNSLSQTTHAATGKLLYRSFIRRTAVAALTAGLLFIAASAVWNTNWLHSEKEHWVDIQNEAGKRTVLLLPDSSTVFLGASSSLRYDKYFGSRNRNLELKGEAYFIVKHQRKYPFSITTGSITTIDVGTAFNIRSVENEPDIEVTVTEGEVDVLDHSAKEGGNITRLTKLQRLTFSNSNGSIRLDTVTPDEFAGGWKDGVLAFREKTLGHVAHELERYYNIQVDFIHPGEKEILLTTTLQNATVDEAIEIISLTAGVKIKRAGNIVTIQ